ncbi:hypothetical protein ACFXJ5_38510 [Streptomyces sp. NPDC059373]
MRLRCRLAGDGRADLLLDLALERLREAGQVMERGRQRTDSTHIPAAVRDLTRREQFQWLTYSNARRHSALGYLSPWSSNSSTTSGLNSHSQHEPPSGPRPWALTVPPSRVLSWWAMATTARVASPNLR